MNGLRYPAEWEAHEACWLAWPADAEQWLEDLEPARKSFVGLCRGIAQPRDAGSERLEILVQDEAAEAEARARLVGQIPGLPVRFHRIAYGDIWLRDTAPIFIQSEQGAVISARFRFNGWGGKYVLPGDDQVAERVAEAAGLPEQSHAWVLEGGSLDSDGEGTLLTTRQCLLNPNRNPGLSQADLEARLSESLGARKVIWLGDGLLNDHTDGHVDNVARFVSPGVVVCMKSSTSDDPNREILDALAAELSAATDAKGRRLKVVCIPSPGRVEAQDANGRRLIPASYLNFYIANHSVVVPTYGARFDAEAVAELGKLFPGRRAIGVDAKAVLSNGGGAFHCITQQQPRST